jgi:apolipoprotein N-acyltransferase
MSTKARIRLVLVAILVVLAVVRYPAIRWFVLISVVLGGLVAVILHFVNKRPVKLESDEVRLHLLDDDDKREVKP